MDGMVKRLATTVLLLALLGVAACGDEPGPVADIPAALQRAIEARDQGAYQRVLAAARHQRPLADRDLHRLADAVRNELRASLAWPGPYCPSARTLLEGAAEPARWFMQSYAPTRNAKAIGATLVRHLGEGPFLPADARLMDTLRHQLRSDDDEMALCAARLLAYTRREDRLTVARELIEATTHKGRDVARQCCIALADLGAAVVPDLAATLRSGPKRLDREMAWTLSMMDGAAAGAQGELETLLDHEDMDVRRLAAKSLISFDRSHARARETLLTDLSRKRSDPGRYMEISWLSVVETVADLGLVEDVPALEEIARRSDLPEHTSAVLRGAIERLKSVGKRATGK